MPWMGTGLSDEAKEKHFTVFEEGRINLNLLDNENGRDIHYSNKGRLEEWAGMFMFVSVINVVIEILSFG